jgi:LEA14-like dessication related protein
MTRIGRAAIVAAALATTAGCASIGRMVFAEPTVELRDVVVKGLGIDGGSLDVVLGVYNPNRFSLKTVKVTYRVTIDTATLASGETPQRYSMAAGDTTLVRIPVEFTYRGLGAAAAQFLSRGLVRYRVAGDLGVQTPIGTFTRPYDRTGEFAPVRR